MSDELFLILHKVRGSPAFDIATLCEEMGTPSDPGPWWIIPTSGHRAYPWRWWKIEDLYDGSDMDMPKPEYIFDTVDAPEGWPDHYVERPSPSAPRLVTSLLAALGLGSRPDLRRRKL